MEALVANHAVNTEQMQWLSLVREQVIKNLSMDEDDFDLAPLLQGRRGAPKEKFFWGA